MVVSMPAFETLGEVNRYTNSSKYRLCCIRAALTDRPSTHLSQCVSPPLALAEASAQGLCRSQLWSQSSESVACAWFLKDDFIRTLKECPYLLSKTFIQIFYFSQHFWWRRVWIPAGPHRRVVSDNHLYWPLLLNNIAVSVGYFLFKNATSQQLNWYHIFHVMCFVQ